MECKASCRKNDRQENNADRSATQIWRIKRENKIKTKNSIQLISARGGSKTQQDKRKSQK
jgi:hypothetical protein